MYKGLLTLFCSVFVFTAIDLKPVDNDNCVTFEIKNFGINTKGELKGLKGTINWDAENPSNSSFNVTVDVNTINTGIDLRDNDLKKEKYFNAEKYPVISFVSTAINDGNVAGNLTIKGNTKNISFPYTATTSGKGYLFEGSFTINRNDFNVGGGSLVLADDADVTLKIQANP